MLKEKVQGLLVWPAVNYRVIVFMDQALEILLNILASHSCTNICIWSLSQPDFHKY